MPIVASTGKSNFTQRVISTGQGIIPYASSTGNITDAKVLSTDTILLVGQVSDPQTAPIGIDNVSNGSFVVGTMDGSSVMYDYAFYYVVIR